MSIKQIYVAPGNLTISSGLDTYVDFACGVLSSNTTEANKAAIVRTNGGVFDHLSCYLSANTLGANATIKFRKNSGAANQAVTLTSSTTGLFQDTSNTDTIVANDTVDLEVSVGVTTGSATTEFVSMVCDPTTNFRLFGNNTGNNLGTANIYKAISGFQAFTVESDAQSKFRTAGTLQKAQAIISTNTSASDNTVSIRINGATKNIAITVTALTTGSFEDTSNTDAVAASDLVNWLCVNTGGTTSAAILKVEFLASGSVINQVLGHVGTGTVNDGATVFLAISGRNNNTATEVNTKVPIDYGYTASNLECYVDINGTTSNSVMDLRVNGVSSALSVSITSGTTGFFADTSNTVIGNSADLINLRIVNGAGGSLDLEFNAMLMNETQPVSSVSVSLAQKKRMLLGVGL